LRFQRRRYACPFVKTRKFQVIQMPECWLTWPVSIDGQPPTEEERKHAGEQMQRLVNNADARKKNRDEIDADGKKSAALLKLLPDAFSFTRGGVKAGPFG
jgi:hypothetical protein